MCPFIFKYLYLSIWNVYLHEISEQTRSFYLFILLFALKPYLWGSAAPDNNPRWNARSASPAFRSQSDPQSESYILHENPPASFDLQTRHDGAAVLREKSGQQQRRTGAAQSVLERRPHSGFIRSTQWKTRSPPAPAHAADRGINTATPKRRGRAKNARFYPHITPQPPPPPTHTHTSRRRSGAQRGGICLLPTPRSSFSGERCRRDPLTPHSPGKPRQKAWYSLVTRFTRRPIVSTRPYVCHHIHFHLLLFFLTFHPPCFFFLPSHPRSRVHSQALPAQP